jgi:prepilin signal peptidase PulO-like enzyme (type II secretory pathway)
LWVRRWPDRLDLLPRLAPGARAARKTHVALGPSLAAGGIVAALVGDPLIHAYLHGL